MLFVANHLSMIQEWNCGHWSRSLRG